jgi:hypothetical protein
MSSAKDKKSKDTNSQTTRNGGREDDLFGTNVNNDNRQSQFDGSEEEGTDVISEFF